jgi:thiol-disulfide isomerase/thioredoxin
MKQLILLLVLGLFAFTSKAQLSSGSLAPNWTLTDINGESHTLYDYLDEGKTVFLIFSATWCPPCWSYHNNPAMKDFWNTYGPDGLDEAMVFFIEADLATTSADLNGTGGNTRGDWVTGTPFPIVDLTNSTVRNNYRINYFPTIYGIYPNRFLTETGGLSLAGLTNFHSNAPRPATEAVEISLVNYTGMRAACEGTTNIGVRVQNYGTQPLTAFDLTVRNRDNGEVIDLIQWTGNLPKYALTEISQNIDLDERVDVVLEARAEGQEIFELSNLEVDLLATPTLEIPSNLARVFVRTDDNAADTYYEVRNSRGDLLASRDGLSNNQVYENAFLMRFNECYVFTIFDRRGNGLSGNAYYRIQDNSGNVFAEGRDFSFEASEAFKRGVLSSQQENLQIKNLSVYPIPAQSEINIVLDSEIANNCEFSLMNMEGSIVRLTGSEAIYPGENKVQWSVSDLPSGNYLLGIRDADGRQVVKKISIQR